MSETRQWDVLMETFVCVEIPADVDPSTQDGAEVLRRAAIDLYLERLRTNQCEFTWEEFVDE